MALQAALWNEEQALLFVVQSCHPSLDNRKDTLGPAAWHSALCDFGCLELINAEAGLGCLSREHRKYGRVWIAASLLVSRVIASVRAALIWGGRGTVRGRPELRSRSNGAEPLCCCHGGAFESSGPLDPDEVKVTSSE